MLMLLVLALAIPAAAAPGYWRYQGYRVEPDPSSLPKGMPARQISGGLQVKPATSGSLSMGFSNEDADKAQYATNLVFGFQSSRSFEHLLPGDKVRIRAQLSFGGNAKAAALPSDASGQLAVDNGEYFLDISNKKIGEPAAAEGDMVVPGGGPGATMDIRVTAYIGTYGAFSGKMIISYAWADGTPPPATPAAGTSPAPPAPARPSAGSWPLTSDGYPSIAGDWTEAPYTVAIVQQAGGRFIATCNYDGKAWRIEGTITRDGQVDARLEHTLGVPSDAIGYAQRRRLTLSPDGQRITGTSTFEGGSHPVDWRRNPAK
jgi:hypothetical protein